MGDFRKVLSRYLQMKKERSRLTLKKAGIFVEKVVLEGQDKENYKVLPEQQPQLQCTVTVKKRPVKLKVSDGTRGIWSLEPD